MVAPVATVTSLLTPSAVIVPPTTIPAEIAVGPVYEWRWGGQVCLFP